jgi:glycosyltransferase involved in cell wall biosynthesis
LDEQQVNILSLNNYNYLRGGAERVFFDEARLLREHGNTVHVFARRHPQNVPSLHDSFFPSEMVTDSLKPTITCFRSFLQVFYSYDAKRHLAAMLKNISIDLAHAHNIYGRLTTSVLDLLHEHNIRVLMTLHDYKLICPSYKLMRAGAICEDCKHGTYYNAIRRRCHKGSFLASAIYACESYFNDVLNKYRKKVRFFISPSLFLRKKLIEFGWPPSKIMCIPNFVNESRFRPLYAPGDYFLYIGRLSSEKGLSTLVRAFRGIRSKNAKLIIVGEGPCKNELQTIASPDPRIRFAGYLSGDPLEQVTRNALAVVVPSEWYENAPLSVLEALAYGKPVIGSRIGGIPEMIDDGVNGFLFESADSADLRDKLEFVLSMSPHQITEMGRAARRRIETDYTADLHYRRLMDVYQMALSRVNSSGAT